MEKATSQLLVIFGASGDLTKRKLIPAIYQLYKENLLPDQFAILGASRTTLTDEAFRKRMTEFLPEEETPCGDFLQKLYYQPLGTEDKTQYSLLKSRLNELSVSLKIANNYIFYLSTPPRLYDIIPQNLAAVGLNNQDDGFKRLIIEKPFGTTLDTAKALNRDLLNHFNEEQIYRIDHYLGKETVQNLLVARFSNAIFEPIWNRNFIERVEITSSESLGVESRGGYYDQSGAMRDMVQNHLLQLVGMVAMEPPVIIEADAIRNEVLKVFQSLRPLSPDDVKKNVIRGQYTASTIRGEKMKSYREETGVNPESRTETFLAMKFFIDNWRWSDVPFYIRTGKKLPTRVTEVVINFRPTPFHLFHQDGLKKQISNQLIIRIQPDEGMLLKFGMKEPGAGFQVKPINMDFHYSDLADINLPTAYQRLLLDCMQGDATLYSRGDAVEAAWEFVQPLIDAWNEDQTTPILGYPAGSWGPLEADQLIEGENTWRYPCKNLTDDGLYCEL